MYVQIVVKLSKCYILQLKSPMVDSISVPRSQHRSQKLGDRIDVISNIQLKQPYFSK